MQILVIYFLSIFISGKKIFAFIIKHINGENQHFRIIKKVNKKIKSKKNLIFVTPILPIVNECKRKIILYDGMKTWMEDLQGHTEDWQA